GNETQYPQIFSAIASGRGSERLTVDQRVPSHSVGGWGQWTQAIGGAQALIVGAEGREVGGASEEPPNRVEGSQRNGAVYVEDIIDIGPRANFIAALRGDGWKNFDARRNGTALSDRSDSASS